jgi:tetratricopeptide (TPR) repeat protein
MTTFDLRRLAMVAAVAFAVGCSGTSEKKDEQPTGGQPEQVESGASAEELINSPNTTESVPSADNLEPQGEKGTGQVDSGVAGDIRDALDDATKGDLESAARDLESLSDNPNGGFLAAYNLGVIRERQGKYEQAAKAYFKSLTNNPDFSPALENLVKLYLRQDQTGDAERIARKFAEQQPDNIDHRVVLLRIDFARGAYEDVIRGAKELLRRDERNVEAMTLMADANFRLERYELSKAILIRAIELAPNRAELYSMYGTVALQLDDPDKARVNFEKAVEVEPGYPEARNNLGVLYHRARDYTSAVEQFRVAINNYPDYKEAYLNLGNAYKGLARYKDAELAFKKALTIDQGYADAHFNLGILYLDSEIAGVETIPRLQKAIDSFNKYKSAAQRLPKDDPADKYIAEAKNAIEVEKQRQEMMRESQMGAETTE